MKLIQITAVAAALTVLVAFAGLGRPGSARSASGDVASTGITVTGQAAVKAVPDEATFSFGVSSDGATGAEATSANASKMDRILAVLRRDGIAKEDIQTEEVSVSPRISPTGDPESGYTASNSVSVIVHDVKRAGAIVDDATAAGATGVSGPSFDRVSRGDLYREALRKAFADARTKAQTLADAANLKVGGVTKIEEQQAEYGPMPLAERAQAASSTPIEPGTQDVSATVTVTFAIG